MSRSVQKGWTKALVGVMMALMKVRRATNEDVEALAQLGAYVQELHHHHRPDWFRPADPEAARPLYTELLGDPSVTAYIAEDGPGDPVGYVVARVTTRAETPLTWTARVVDIDQIGVAPHARRRGIGNALIRAARSLAQEVDADRLHLTVWEFNEAAQAFFSSQGLHLAMRRMTEP